jgi:hypothetical protein
MHTSLTLRLEPIANCRKPRAAVDAAADLARRIGCHVAVEINGATVKISPTTPKATAFEQWSAAKAGAGTPEPAPEAGGDP